MAVTIAGKTPKQLLEERAEIITSLQARHEQRGDDWSAEDDAIHAEGMDDAAKLLDAAKRGDAIQKAISAESPQVREAARPNPQDMPGSFKPKDTSNKITIRNGSDENGAPRYVEIEVSARGADEYRRNFAAFLKTGRAAPGLHIAPDSQDGTARSFALQSDVAEQAGFLVASEQFASELLREVDDLVFVRRYARIHTVPEATSLGIRVRTARAQTFAWSQELTVSDEDASLKYGKRSLTPHHLTGSVKLSRDLVRRSLVSAEGEVRMELARDAGEMMEDAYLMGSGSQQPLGVFTASNDGISTARDVLSGSATNITLDGLISARFALKSQYRSGARGALRWLFHRNVIEKIALLKDSTGQPVFRVGAGRQQDTGHPEDTIFGIPVDESERAPSTLTSGQYIGLLANWRYYEIADALSMEIQVLNELNARTNQIEYIGRLKTDGQPTLAEAFVRIITN